MTVFSAVTNHLGWDGAYLNIYLEEELVYSRTMDIISTIRESDMICLEMGRTYRVVMTSYDSESLYHQYNSDSIFFNLGDLLFQGFAGTNETFEVPSAISAESFASTGGGSFYFLGGELFEIENTSFHDSSSGSTPGGTISVLTNDPRYQTQLSINNSVITSSETSVLGGALYSFFSDVEITNLYINTEYVTSLLGDIVYNMGGNLECLSSCIPGSFGDCEVVDECWSCVPGACTLCGAGKYLPLSGAVEEAQCLDCPEGRYTPHYGLTACSVCKRGYYVTDDANDTSGIGLYSGGTHCVACPAGKFANVSSGSTSCDECSSGKTSFPSMGALDCVPCGAGRFAATRIGASECTACSSGKYQNNTGETSCMSCTLPENSQAGANDCDICIEGYYRDGGVCHSCPNNADCPGKKISGIKLAPDFWRSNQDSSVVLPCTELGFCKGGLRNESNFCRPYSHGPYCSVCQGGYWKQGNKCSSCSDVSIGLVSTETWVLMGVMAIFLIVFVKLMSPAYNGDAKLAKQMIKARRKYQRLKTKMKITLCFMQIMTEFPAQFGDVNYPAIVRDFYSHVAVYSSFDLYRLFPSVSCLQSSVNQYFSKLVAVTLTPLAIVLVGAVYHAVLRQRRIQKGKPVDTFSSHWQFYFFLFTYLIFVPCSSTVLKTFHCDDKFDDIGYLFADYTTKCGTVQYRALWLYASLFILVYPIGIPAMYFLVLYRRHHDIDPVLEHTPIKARMHISRAHVEEAVEKRNHDLTLESLRFLFESYEPKYWWWEVLICAHRLIMTSANIFLPVSSSILSCILLALSLVAVKIYSYCDPYLLDSDDLFAEVSEWNIVMFLIFNIVFQLNKPSFELGIICNIVLVSMVGALALVCLQTISTEIKFFRAMGLAVSKAWSGKKTTTSKQGVNEMTSIGDIVDQETSIGNGIEHEPEPCDDAFQQTCSLNCY